MNFITGEHCADLRSNVIFFSTRSLYKIHYTCVCVIIGSSGSVDGLTCVSPATAFFLKRWAATVCTRLGFQVCFFSLSLIAFTQTKKMVAYKT